MNQDVRGNIKLFLKEVDKMNGGKEENCSRIRGKTGKMALGEEDM